MFDYKWYNVSAISEQGFSFFGNPNTTGKYDIAIIDYDLSNPERFNNLYIKWKDYGHVFMSVTEFKKKYNI